MKRYSELRAEARAALSGKWTMAALVTLIYLVISVGLSYLPINAVLRYMLIYIVMLPVGYGYSVLFLDVFRKTGDVELGKLFDGFKDFSRVFCTLLLMVVYTILWTLLLIVPGIMKSYSYAMTAFILRDEPQLKNNEAIEKSMRMMEGHKMNLFVLDLTFIGWILLGIVTCGLGLLWVEPYIEKRTGRHSARDCGVTLFVLYIEKEAEALSLFIEIKCLPFLLRLSCNFYSFFVPVVKKSGSIY